MVNVDKWTGLVIGIVFVLALMPVAFDEIAAFTAAYPEWATLIGLVSLALIFGLVRQAMQATKTK